MRWTQQTTMITNLRNLCAAPIEVTIAVPEGHDVMALQKGATEMWKLHHRPSQCTTHMLDAPLEAWQAVLTLADLDALAALVTKHAAPDFRFIPGTNVIAGAGLASGFSGVLSGVCDRLERGGWEFRAFGIEGRP